MKCFLTVALVLFSTLFGSEYSANFNHPEQVQGVDIFLTYPRSGTNWTMGILQILTRKPVINLHLHGEAKFDKFHISVNRLGFDLDKTKSPLCRTHTPDLIKKINRNKNKLLFNLRNYKECIVRNHFLSADELKNSVLNETSEFKKYIDNLKCFDNWPEQNKHIIYYEDLIKYPKIEIPKLLAFMNENAIDLESFYSNFDYWRNLVLGSYQNQHGLECSSGGDKEVFHSKEFPIETLKEIDQYIKGKYPHLWEKYLSRYETL
ncbi:MAG: sulfotransferase domain-containing protein [Chlamydiota bacterium]